MRLAITGPGRCGKDTASNWFAEHTTLRYKESTSQASAKMVFKALKARYGYTSVEECFDDRSNHRKEWYDIIRAYNEPDGMTLYREMIEKADILNGIRGPGEIRACQQAGLVTLSLWVDRPHFTESQSLAFGPEACDIVIPNHTGLKEYFAKLRNLSEALGIFNG